MLYSPPQCSSWPPTMCVYLGEWGWGPAPSLFCPPLIFWSLPHSKHCKIFCWWINDSQVESQWNHNAWLDSGWKSFFFFTNILIYRVDGECPFIKFWVGGTFDSMRILKSERTIKIYSQKPYLKLRRTMCITERRKGEGKMTAILCLSWWAWCLLVSPAGTQHPTYMRTHRDGKRRKTSPWHFVSEIYQNNSHLHNPIAPCCQPSRFL